MAPKKQQTPIRLEPEIRQRLDLFLARGRRQWGSINAIVNEALDRFLPSLAELQSDTRPPSPAPAPEPRDDTAGSDDGDGVLDFND